MAPIDDLPAATQDSDVPDHAVGAAWAEPRDRVPLHASGWSIQWTAGHHTGRDGARTSPPHPAQTRHTAQMRKMRSALALNSLTWSFSEKSLMIASYASTTSG